MRRQTGDGTAWADGNAAYCAGHPETANPHPSGTAEREAWMEGWHHCRAADLLYDQHDRVSESAA